MNFSVGELRLSHRVMTAGDTVIIYESHTSLDHIILKKGDSFNNKFGLFHHDNFIGKPFGSRVQSNSTGWVYALEPSPELWSTAMNTRTQIVDSCDSSIIVSHLDIFPGCVVVESGTGSGNLTMSLARAVGRSGHVHTFEYNQHRADDAAKDFASLGVSSWVTVRCKDVCGKSSGSTAGFDDVAPATADAVFLDLPEPWLAVPHAWEVLKPGRHLCSYSPCMEQVSRACEAMRAAGFHSIRMIEVRQRPFDGRVVQMEMPDLGRNIASSHNIEHSNKKQRTEDVTTSAEAVDSNNSSEEQMDEDPEEEVKRLRRRNHYSVQQLPCRAVSVARPLPSMKGHTAFLTFATKCDTYKESSPAGDTGVTSSVETSI